MAIAPLSIPQLGAVSSFDLQTPLAQLGQQYRQQQEQSLLKDTLARATAGGQIDPAALIGSGNMSLAQLGLQYKNRQEDQARQAAQDARQRERDAATDKYQEATLGLQRRAQDRLDATANETPADKARQRLAAARENGIDPNSAEGRRYVLTGDLPTASATSPIALLEERRAAAAGAGLKPDSPAYQGYLLTGKTPREDAQPLTAGDKEAIRVADDAVVANQAAIDSLNRAKGLSKQAFTGPAAGTRGYAASFLGETSDLGRGGIATENLTNEVMTNALGQLKSIFGGNPTEGERKILLDLQGSVNKPDAVRQAIFDRATAAAQKRLEFNQKRADELRGGTYYKNQKPTATSAPAAVAQGGNGDPLALARDAIQRGADPVAVRKRLQDNGIDPSGI